MQEISLPTALTQKDWLAKVTPAVDKQTKVGTSLAAVGAAFDKVPVKLFDFSAVKDADEANKRLKEIEEKVARPLQAIVGLLKKLEGDLKSAQDALKKAGKDSAVKPLLAAMNSFSGEAKSVPEAALDELRSVIKDLEAADKKAQEAATKGKPDPAAEKQAAEQKKVLGAHNAKVKKFVRELGTGKIASYPFAFAQNKVVQPYSKGKPWDAKSLAHVGPKAVKGFKSQFEDLIGTAAFVFSCGTVRCATDAKGKVNPKKLVLEFETSLANPKQLKAALLFQLGYSPALQLRKASGEVLEEAGEGEDEGEELEGADDDLDTGPLLTAAQKKILDDAIALPGDGGKLIKRKLDEAEALAKSAAGAAKAKALVAEAETVAKALLAKAGGVGKGAAGAPAGVAADVAERIRKAGQSWEASSTAAEKGIDQVMLALNKMFDGDARQAPKVKDALRTLNSLKPKLKSDLGNKLAEATQEANDSRRASLIKEAIAAATQVEKRISDDPIMGELDGANNDVLPGVNIIGPMKSALGAIRALA